MTKYIFVTGGVVSSLGKGIAAASIGRLLKSRELEIAVLKFDPYINVDPGAMSPYQHGEVFVTRDGSETDLDLGHYERFIDINLTGNSSVTTGKIYWSVLTKEREGKYGGSTVQVVPHITNEIKDRIRIVQEESRADVVIVEVGGTIGDLESLPFLEAIRQFRREKGSQNVLNIHMALVPYLKVSREAKTKPVQHSVKELRALGINPDIIMCRTEVPLSGEMVDKIALACDVDPSSVVQAMDVDSIYDIPLNYESEGIGKLIVEKLNLDCKVPDLQSWATMVGQIKYPSSSVDIAIVGKYAKLQDAYISLSEALMHAGAVYDTKVNLSYINSETIDRKNVADKLSHYAGILVPSGTGVAGTSGKIEAIRYAREKGVPLFGIGLGMHLSMIEFARNVIGLPDANSLEFTECMNPIIVPIHNETEAKGLLGLYDCQIVRGTKAHNLYGKDAVFERYRSKYKFNCKYKDAMNSFGMVIADKNFSDIIELPSHPWFIGTQFHPEYESRPNRPHPLFKGFVEASIQHSKSSETVKL